MFVARLRLSDFRSYESAEISLNPGVCVFLGPNGYGKTNIVEAVQYVATLASHRVAGDGPLIRAGAQSGTVSVKVCAGRGDARALSVDVEIRQGAPNRARLNRAPARPKDVIGAVRTVFFAPEDLSIVRGDPARRRDFLDELVMERWPRLAGVKSDYDKALRQKTALLKAMSGRSVRMAGAGAESTLGVWDEALITKGAELVSARLRTVEDMREFVTDEYDQIAPVGSHARIEYVSSSPVEGMAGSVAAIEGVLGEHIAQRRDDEIARGVCLVGPHRDDVGLILGTLPVKGYASHGEGWSFALALRLASLDLLHDDGLDPVLILDDVFAELDDVRRERVVSAMESVEQTLVTAAVERDLPEAMSAWVYRVSPGRIEEPTVRSGSAGSADSVERGVPEAETVVERESVSEGVL